MNKIKVCLSFLCFPLTMAHYFWKAFERREDVELFVMGPFFDDYIPWNFGMKIPREYVKQPHLALPPSTARVSLPYSFVAHEMPWKPDLFLQIDAGWHFSTKPDAGVVGLVKTDPHVLDYSVPKAYSDLSFCMQSPYMQEGDIFLPYAYDKEIHYPEKREIKYDACLIGLHYEQRDRLVERLRSRGLNVYYSIGEIENEYRARYCESKIALSWSSRQDTPARCWEALGMKLPLVTNNVPDMGRFFSNGTDYLGFDTLEEAEKQVMRLMVDSELCNRIACRGHHAVQPHSWDSRVDKILWEAKLI